MLNNTNEFIRNKSASFQLFGIIYNSRSFPLILLFLFQAKMFFMDCLSDIVFTRLSRWIDGKLFQSNKIVLLTSCIAHNEKLQSSSNPLIEVHRCSYWHWLSITSSAQLIFHCGKRKTQIKLMSNIKLFRACKSHENAQIGEWLDISTFVISKK